MDYFSRIPITTQGAAKFIIDMSNIILRDFSQINRLIPDKKLKFVEKTILNWEKKKSEFLEKEKKFGNIDLFLEGTNNMSLSMSDLCFTCVANTDFVVYYPHMDILFWNSKKEYYLNDRKIEKPQKVPNELRYSSSFFPPSLQICYFLTHALNIISVEGPLAFLFDKKIVFHDYAKKYPGFDSYKSFLELNPKENE